MLQPHPKERIESARVMMYGHDSFGLGHLRRNLNLAGSLVEHVPGCEVLIATGSPCSSSFPLPPGVASVKLPSVTKDDRGDYVPRQLAGAMERVARIRRGLLLETFRTFEPDVLIVDHSIVGLFGEVEPLLREARRCGVRTVLGLRDVIDSPAAVDREWAGDLCRWAFSEAYDRILVYGDPSVFDPRTEYTFPGGAASRLEFTGYVVRPRGKRSRRPYPSLRPSVLVTVGGGEDGADRLYRYLEALEAHPVAWDSTLLLGPLIPERDARQLKRAARAHRRISVHRFHADLPRLLSDADVVVSMAGYNTCAEVLQSETPAVFLPRTFPRQEQRIRADRLAARGWGLSLTDPDPKDLHAAVCHQLFAPREPSELPDLAGASTVGRIVGGLLGASPKRPSSRGIQGVLS